MMLLEIQWRKTYTSTSKALASSLVPSIATSLLEMLISLSKRIHLTSTIKMISGTTERVTMQPMETTSESTISEYWTTVLTDGALRSCFHRLHSDPFCGPRPM